MIPLTTAYGLSLYVAGAILLFDGLAELISLKWGWKYSKPVLRFVVAATALVVALSIYQVPVAVNR